MEKQKTGSGEQHDGLEKDHCAVFVWKEIIKMQKRIKNPLHKYTYRIIIMHNYSENIQLYASAPTKTCREEKLRSLLTRTGRKADWDPANYDREEKRL